MNVSMCLKFGLVSRLLNDRSKEISVPDRKQSKICIPVVTTTARDRNYLR